MKLIFRNVKELEDSQYDACYSLNHRSGGLMRDRLVLCKESFSQEGYSVMLYDEDILLSWALVFAYDLDIDLWGAYFYTRAESRRKGYGDQVAEEVKQHFKNVKTWPDNERGKAFFQKHGFNLCFDWWIGD